MKLLIVDDHAGVRALIRQLATMATASRECSCGRDALAVAPEFQPDVITMDIRLPDRDGIEVTRELRRLCPSARIIVVTSYNLPELRQAALRAGAVQFMAKDNLLELKALLTHVMKLPETRPDGGEQT